MRKQCKQLNISLQMCRWNKCGKLGYSMESQVNYYMLSIYNIVWLVDARPIVYTFRAFAL